MYKFLGATLCVVLISVDIRCALGDGILIEKTALHGEPYYKKNDLQINFKETPSPPQCQPGDRKGVENACKDYYECDKQSVWVHKSCNTFCKVYDSMTSKCVWNWQKPCLKPSTTPAPSTISPNPSPTTQAPSTFSPTPSPTTQVPSTISPSPSPTSQVPSTASPTPSPTTQVSSTISPTLSPTSQVPSTISPTPSPATQVPSTISSTPLPSTQVPSTISPSPSPTSQVPSTSSPSPSPTVQPPSTISPTLLPTTLASLPTAPTPFPTSLTSSALPTVPSSTSAASSTTAVPKCSPEGSQKQLKKGDCKNYLKCTSGKWVQQTCSFGYDFDINKLTCVFSWFASKCN